MKLYGKQWTRREIEARVGRLEQIGGIRRLQLTEGPEAGVELIQVSTGAGLTYYVSPSRGLDISLTKFCDVPISWQSPNGDVFPAYYEPEYLEWLRTAAGGLLMTCGLNQVGSPGEDAGEKLGLHGRIHHTPARHVAAEGTWIGDEYDMRIAGSVEQTRIFGEHLRLNRQILSRMGRNEIQIHDTVENIGFEPCPHMLLYHFNFGFPLMADETTIRFPSHHVVPREQETPLAEYDSWQQPTPGFSERVYYHSEFEVNANSTEVIIQNPNFSCSDGSIDFPLAVKLSWNTKQLPKLVQWKMPGTGVHVLGIEPANCWVEGRAIERKRGTLHYLQPGEKRTYDVSVTIEKITGKE